MRVTDLPCEIMALVLDEVRPVFLSAWRLSGRAQRDFVDDVMYAPCVPVPAEFAHWPRQRLMRSYKRWLRCETIDTSSSPTSPSSFHPMQPTAVPDKLLDAFFRAMPWDGRHVRIPTDEWRVWLEDMCQPRSSRVAPLPPPHALPMGRRPMPRRVVVCVLSPWPVQDAPVRRALRRLLSGGTRLLVQSVVVPLVGYRYDLEGLWQAVNLWMPKDSVLLVYHGMPAEFRIDEGLLPAVVHAVRTNPQCPSLSPVRVPAVAYHVLRKMVRMSDCLHPKCVLFARRRQPVRSATPCTACARVLRIAEGRR